MSTVGVFSTLRGYHKYTGGYHDECGGYHEYIGGCSVYWGFYTNSIVFPKTFPKDLNRHQFFSTNKQYVKIKLMQNRDKSVEYFLVKTKYW